MSKTDVLLVSAVSEDNVDFFTSDFSLLADVVHLLGKNVGLIFTKLSNQERKSSEQFLTGLSVLFKARNLVTSRTRFSDVKAFRTPSGIIFYVPISPLSCLPVSFSTMDFITVHPWMKCKIVSSTMH